MELSKKDSMLCIHNSTISGFFPNLSVILLLFSISTILSLEARLKYIPNNNRNNTPLDFSLSFDGQKTKNFWRVFQKKFGEVDDPKISYD